MNSFKAVEKMQSLVLSENNSLILPSALPKISYKNRNDISTVTTPAPISYSSRVSPNHRDNSEQRFNLNTLGASLIRKNASPTARQILNIAKTISHPSPEKEQPIDIKGASTTLKSQKKRDPMEGWELGGHHNHKLMEQVMIPNVPGYASPV